MTGTDMSLDITYQDTQYLSELYAKLGALQYDLANFDVLAIETALLVGVIVVLAGILIGMVMMAVILDYNGHLTIPEKAFVIGLIIYLIILVAAWLIISDVTIMFKENAICRDIESTELAIESIKMKYGLL